MTAAEKVARQRLRVPELTGASSEVGKERRRRGDWYLRALRVSRPPSPPGRRRCRGGG